MNSNMHTRRSRNRRTSPLKLLFATMTMVLIISGTVSPIMPLLETAIAAAPNSEEPLPIKQEPIKPPIIIDDPIILQPSDSDQDGIPDSEDSCPKIPNEGTDWDNDGTDDACDPQPPAVGEPPADSDLDGIPDSQDSCPTHPNLGTDWDGDGTDDACDPPPRDSDQDGAPDSQDSCPKLPNLGTDWDNDGIDDACDPPPPEVISPDSDGDGIPDSEDSCPDMANTGNDWNTDGIDDACDPLPPDSDGDGIGDHVDSCVDIPNSGSDYNNDGTDDACDPPPGDRDNDGILDDDDSCPDAPNRGTDWNADGIDDACDPEPLPADTDGDGVPDDEDSCPGSYNTGTDSDGDGIDDACDPIDVVTHEPDRTLETNDAANPVEYIAIDMRYCPAGTDFTSYTGTTEGPGSLCDEPWIDATGVLESKTDSTISYSEMAPAPTSSPFMSHIEFRPLPIDTWNFHVETASPLADEALFCSSYNAHGNTKPYGSASFALTAADPWKIYDLESKSGEYTYCFWYGIATDPGDLKLTKYECTTLPPAASPYEWYRDNCTTTMDDVNFTLDMPDPDPDISRATNHTGVPGYLEMLGLEPATYPLVETVPPGYTPQALFCRYTWIDAPSALLTPTQVTITGDTAEVTIEARKVLNCFWFNISGDVATDPGDLMLMKYECTTTPPASAPYEWYRDNCTTTMDGVNFTLDKPDPDPDISTMTNDTGTSGYIQMLGVDPGTYPLIETPPAGYTPTALFCADIAMSTTPLDSEYMPVTLTGNSADVTITSNRLLYCKMFNLQDEGTITILKMECPATTASDADMTWLADNCTTPMEGVDFSLTHGIDSYLMTTDATGMATHSIGAGNIVVSELVPEGYDSNPMAVCGFKVFDGSGLPVSGMPAKVEITSAMWTFDVPDDNTDIMCIWFNVPIPNSTVTIHKYECPEGMPAEMTADWFSANCTTPMEVAFALTDTKGPRELTSSGGVAQWTDVATGPVQIMETIPAGYAQQPFLICITTDSDGISSAPFTPATVNGVWNTAITAGATTIECDWYNWYLGPGEITVNKLTCPAGYDHTAWGADPMTDCVDATDGITFKLDQPDPAPDIFSDTGDSIPGAVYFGGLEPGDYTITEMLDPAVTMQEIFVWQCVGLNSSAVHPTPLSVGQSLNFQIVGGDEIVCHWFNVPRPDLGWMEVHKFNCTTETYVQDVYCYTNQNGQEFNLQVWDGSNWVTMQTGVTDLSGELTFSGLDAGAYRLVEPGTKACLMKSSNITANSELGVATGEGTTVYVYNCKTAPPPQKTPTKYPNTGVGSTTRNDVTRTPILGMAGLVGLLGLQLTRRRMVTSAGLAATSSLTLAMAQQIIPLDEEASPAAGTPEPVVLWCPSPVATTPEVASTPMVDPCNRGAIPIRMRIPIIEVDAPIEYLEIIDGQMQQPTGDTHITWYKETSRLGEIGNGIYAAHLNWWSNPEGIFFRLESLQEGDVIEIDGDDQQTLLYEVQWMQNFPSDEEPPEEALGITNDAVITLITCGGEWSSALSEYDHRTLVRAVLRE